MLCLCLAYRDNIDRGGDRLAALLPRIHNQMQRDLSRDNRIGTKCNHISIIKDWLIFCAKTGLDPFSLNPIPKCIIYWLYDRTNRMVKGANSIDTWLNGFNFLIYCLGGRPCYRTEDFKRRKAILIKLYSKPRTPTLPFPLLWLIKWIKCIGVTPLTWYTCEYDDLFKVLLVLFIFFTISRPGEIYYSNKTENINWDIITTGLCWKDITFSGNLMTLSINWYKNQVHYNVPKLIHIVPPVCLRSDCHCRILNFPKMFIVAKARRQALFTRLLLRRARRGPTISNAFQKKLKYLATNPNDQVFVTKEGSVWGYTRMRNLMREIHGKIKTKRPKMYPPYTLKRGAMSLVNQQKIPLLKVIKFVNWSVKSLPHMSQTYISISIPEMAVIPYEMIHGAIRNGNRANCVDLSNQKLVPFDLSDAKEQEDMWK